MSSDEATPRDAGGTSTPGAVVVPWVGSIVVTAIGFLPLGVVALLLCRRSSAALAAGEIEAAAAAARSARVVMWVTVAVAVIVDLAIIGAVLGLGGFS